MITKYSIRLAGRLPRKIEGNLCIPSRSLFGLSANTSKKNRVFTPVRSEDDLTVLLNLPHGRNGRGPLITFWTASFDQQGRTIAEQLKIMIEGEIGNRGEDERGVGFVVVETDAMMATELAPRYMVASQDADERSTLLTCIQIDTIPTLIAFRDSMAEHKSRVTDMDKLRDISYLEDWVKARSAGR
ncbi:MAG: hypothetical protein M1836_006396 [Candelina mexicana]|nr:MAG: hypothetical protein M1836_006396 [Candelina mexicana]